MTELSHGNQAIKIPAIAATLSYDQYSGLQVINK